MGLYSLGIESVVKVTGLYSLRATSVVKYTELYNLGAKGVVKYAGPIRQSKAKQSKAKHVSEAIIAVPLRCNPKLHEDVNITSCF